MQEHSKRWLLPAEAAAYLNTTERAIWAAIDDGQLPFSQIGKRYVLDVLALDAWAESLQEYKSGPATTGRNSGRARGAPVTIKTATG